MKTDPIFNLTKTTLSLMNKAIKMYEEGRVDWVGVCLNCQKILVDEDEAKKCENKNHATVYLELRLLYAADNSLYGAYRCLRWLLRRMQRAKGGAKR